MTKTIRYAIRSLDVWGNEKDGYEVNQSYNTGLEIEVAEDCSDTDLQNAVGEHYPTIKRMKVSFDGDGDLINIDHATRRCTKPLLTLEKTE